MSENEALEQEQEEVVVAVEDDSEQVSETVDVVEEVAEEQVEEKKEESAEDKGYWFIVQCFTGHEYKVQARINQLIERDEFKEKIFRVLVPEEETVEIKNNKRVEKITKIFPGYVFVQMLPDEHASFEIRRLAGVAKFIGSKHSATPVTDEEMLKVLRKAGDKTKKVDVDYEVNEVIKVIGGPFRGYTGPISEINGDRGKLKAMISIFGRETPVELDFDQVEKTV
jgi:transcriptional antiterminator NusG